MAAPFTGLDLAVAASRPRGISDALAVHLAVQIARNERLEAEVASLHAQVARLQADAEGYYRANGQAFSELADARQEVAVLRALLDESKRGGR